MAGAVTFKLFIALTLLVVGTSGAVAGETRQFYRGARAMAMGNAYTAIADDEQAVYLNPAAMAGNPGTQFFPLIADLSLSRESIATVQSFTKFSSDTINGLIGKNVFLQGQVTPTLMFPNFGVSFIVDRQISLRSENRSLPEVVLGLQSTNGLQFAYGFKVGRRASNRRGEFRVGLGLKMMFRRGGYRTISRLDLLSIDQHYLSRLQGNFGRGFGFDLGTQYIRKLNGRATLYGGATYLDIGDTNFGDGPDPIKANASFGAGIGYRMGTVQSRLSYELKNAFDQTDFRKKQHLGVELGFPIFSLYGGFNQVFVTYGAGVDLGLIRIDGASYGEELGSFAYQNTERRYMVRLALKLGF